MGGGLALFKKIRKENRKQHPDHLPEWSHLSLLRQQLTSYNNHKINNTSHKHKDQSYTKQIIIMKIESGKLKRKLQLSCGLGLRVDG